METQNALIKSLIEHFGGQAKTAAAAHVEQPTVSAWLNNRHGVSAKAAIRIQSATDGKFKAADLCPDLEPSNHIAA